jgi:cardiolipin synthase
MNQPAFAEPVPMHAAHAHEILRGLGEPLVGGNQAEVFDQAEQTRDALLGIFGRALNHINLDAALLHTPGLCTDLVACLAEQCRKGVRVQVLAHAMESGEVSAALSELRDVGATVNGISPPRGVFGWIGHRVCSMQRQLAVVDGRVAWCGPGARAHSHGTYGPHLCVQGPIVQRLQRLFLEAWHASGSHVRLPQANYFPPMAASGFLHMAWGFRQTWHALSTRVMALSWARWRQRASTCSSAWPSGSLRAA